MIKQIINYFRSKVKLTNLYTTLIYRALPHNSKSVKRNGVIHFEEIYNQYIIDENYTSCSISDFKKLLKKDFTNWKIYHKDYDCDNFAFKLRSNLKTKHPTLSIGIVFSTSHAYNVFVDNKGTAYYIEPQSDKTFTFNKLPKKYKPIILIIL